MFVFFVPFYVYVSMCFEFMCRCTTNFEWYFLTFKKDIIEISPNVSLLLIAWVLIDTDYRSFTLLTNDHEAR